MTTSTGLLSTASASGEMATPQGAPDAPTISPRSRPALAGSLSIAPVISSASFWRIRRTIEAPMGPTPNCTTRIFFFTVPSLEVCGIAYLKWFARGLQVTKGNFKNVPPLANGAKDGHPPFQDQAPRPTKEKSGLTTRLP